MNIYIEDINNLTLSQDPDSVNNIIKGTPNAKSRTILTGQDNYTDVKVWECEPSKFKAKYDVNETIAIFKGKGKITFDKGEEYILEPGVILTFKKGSSVIWTIYKTIRKIAFHYL